MKRIWLSVVLLTGSLLSATPASAQSPQSAEALLQKMGDASRTLNYELAFITISPKGIIPVRYRHALMNGQPVAQIMQMDSSRREIVQRGQEISYYEPGLDSFSLAGNHIVDYLPAIIFADFAALKAYYNFIDVGRIHIGDHPGRVVRITSKDNSRYNYIVVVDEESGLPLQVELLDLNNVSLEQFRVVSVSVNNPGVTESLKAVQTVTMPPVLAIPQSENVKFDWDVMRLPNGFKELTRNRRQVGAQEWIETVMFSDGVFSFSVNVAKAVKIPENQQTLRQGSRTLYTLRKGNNEITIFGELPMATARQVAEGVTFSGG
ncbi:MAG: sigma-E factor regulatory protein RseB [Morganella sp. (in: enterobacteria)]|uniref:Sigma-E factor regulatory protein RseB n=1 Tax=Morganella psychrotolerans TaxID=368603 RepID=A0A1B8HUL4_9GAMM|nr:sigma-E factor regulatory protein RseB [Morganella psychrotolerans]OBU13554.1 sigma-E factor regulatory protein RseB [Morganella psychrotolerans]